MLKNPPAICPGSSGQVAAQNIPVIRLAMNNKTSLIEVGFLACVVAAATIAFTLMVGNAIWKRMAGVSS